MSTTTLITHIVDGDLARMSGDPLKFACNELVELAAPEVQDALKSAAEIRITVSVSDTTTPILLPEEV